MRSILVATRYRDAPPLASLIAKHGAGQCPEFARWCTQSRSGFPICAYDTLKQCHAVAIAARRLLRRESGSGSRKRQKKERQQ